MKCFFNKYFFVFIIVLLAFTCYQPITYASNNKIVIPTEFQEIDVSEHLEVFVDHKHLSKRNLLSHQDQFIPIQQANVSGDISDAIYWLKLTVSNSSSSDRELFLELKKPHLNKVTLYSLENNSLIEQETIGYSVPYKIRTIKHHNLVFTLHLQPNITSTYYLKVQTESFFQAPVSIWDLSAFSRENYQTQTAFGIFYGVMIAMISYNSFLFVTLREKSYLYYILFITGFTLMQSIWDGFAFQWLWEIFLGGL